MNSAEILTAIESLAQGAMCGDWEHSETASILRAMGRKVVESKDVPVAMEMVALLQHFAPRLPVSHQGDGDVALAPGVVWGDSRLLLLLDVPAESFGDMAHWIADSMPSAKIKALPGLLALPFSIEDPAKESSNNAQAALFPEWFAVFYPYAKPEHAFPILTLRSVLSHDAFGGDWVSAAVGRMGHYGLPRKQAEESLSKKITPAIKNCLKYLCRTARGT